MVSTDVKGFSTEGQRVPSAWPSKVKSAGDRQMTVMHPAPKPFLTEQLLGRKKLNLASHRVTALPGPAWSCI